MPVFSDAKPPILEFWRGVDHVAIQSENYPVMRVAVVIPTLNEAKTLAETLAAIYAQDYPHNLMEILILDGGSADSWEDCLPTQGACDIQHRVIPNPGQTVSAAVNLALRVSDAETILWLSGHCVITPDYVRKCEMIMREHDSVVVGGRLGISGHGPMGVLSALINKSRFGTGAAPSRFETTPGWTKAVTFAMYRRDDLLAVGGLDERMIRNQDTDLWEKLRRHGTRFYRVDAEASYLAPPTLSGLLRKARNNGRWNIWSQRIRRGGLSWWHFAPMAMVGCGAILGLASLFSGLAFGLFVFLVAAYGALAIGSAIKTAMHARANWTIPILPILFLIHHVVYGLGSWEAVCRSVPTAPKNGSENC